MLKIPSRTDGTNAEAYAEGGYESASSNFKLGVAEKIIDEGTRLIKKLL